MYLNVWYKAPFSVLKFVSSVQPESLREAHQHHSEDDEKPPQVVGDLEDGGDQGTDVGVGSEIVEHFEAHRNGGDRQHRRMHLSEGMHRVPPPGADPGESGEQSDQIDDILRVGEVIQQELSLRKLENLTRHDCLLHLVEGETENRQDQH